MTCCACAGVEKRVRGDAGAEPRHAHVSSSRAGPGRAGRVLNVKYGPAGEIVIFICGIEDHVGLGLWQSATTNVADTCYFTWVKVVRFTW